MVAVAGVESYTAVAAGTAQPDDWATTYNTDYFIKDADDDYEPNAQSDWATALAYGLYKKTVSAPTFAANKYYSRTGSGADASVGVTAKYPGTFGNNLRVDINKRTYKVFDGTAVVDKPFWNMIVSVIDASGVKSAVENLTFVYELANSTDAIPYYEEIQSSYVDLTAGANVTDDTEFDTSYVYLANGTDWMPLDSQSSTDLVAKMTALATARYEGTNGDGAGVNYKSAIAELVNVDAQTVNIYYNMEWVYTQLVGTANFDGVFSLLKDKLAYNHNRVISPGWDDQNIAQFTDSDFADINELSPIHVRLMDVAYYSRCATAFIDSPLSLARSKMYDDGDITGYAQMLSEYAMNRLGSSTDINLLLYATHSALFAPWGQYTYVGTSKQNLASPGFLALMISRAQILNQAIQYEWALPTNRKHNLKIGKMQYPVPKKILDIWQPSQNNGGVGVNVITLIPDLGTNIWGNSTLYNRPPATYQALANLSTRLLVNAVEDVAYRCGIAITFQYNNNQAYSSFYAGVTPILDTMRNVGAIDDYYVKMSADINGLDHVNANTVIGKIYLVINGVINDIYIDLIALPQGTNLDQFRG